MKKKNLWTALAILLASVVLLSCGTLSQSAQAELLAGDIKNVSAAVVAIYPENEKVAAGAAVAVRLADELAVGNREVIPLLLALEPDLRAAFGGSVPPAVEASIVAIKIALRRL